MKRVRIIKPFVFGTMTLFAVSVSSLLKRHEHSPTAISLISLARRSGRIASRRICSLRRLRRALGREMAPRDVDSFNSGRLGGHRRIFRLDMSFDAARELAPVERRRSRLPLRLYCALRPSGSLPRRIDT